MKTKLIVTFFALCAIPLFFYASFKQPAENDLKIPRPTTDFSFIKRFYCISDLFDKEQWQNNSGRSFDEQGVQLTNSKRHPVNACHYALFCYDEFNSTGNNIFKEAFLAQVRFLLDSNSYNVIDAGSIAYPYNTKFHDLDTPWYSALAQSEAISVLIRYYALTHDKSALQVIVQLRNFMINPQEGKCGTKSITPEGNTWYEEYPTSKQEKQVLNGFIISTISLYEYSNLFPDDTASARMFKDAVRTIKESFKFYDTGSWLKYNRGDQRLVANGYMKWQVLEMKFLYAITNDPFFKDVRMLVSSYCYNKPYETAGSKLKDYDFSVPLVPGKNNQLVFTGKNAEVILSSEVSKISSTFAISVPELTKMYDGNANTFANFKSLDSMAIGSPNICLNFKSGITLGSIAINYAGLDSLEKPALDFYYKTSVTNPKWSHIKISDLKKDTKSNTYFFAPVNAQVIWLVFENYQKFLPIKISNLSLLKPAELVASDYQHYITQEYSGSSKGVVFNLEQKGMNDVVVFHKSAPNSKALNSEKWNPITTYRKFPVKFETDTVLLHKFLIICEPKNASSTIGNISVQPL